jgi:hypothetical protein
MIDLTQIQYPWAGANEWLNNLPAYNCNHGVDTMLDLMREIQESGNYYYQGLAFPNLTMQPTVPALGTINGVVVISAGSYVTGISGIAQSGADTTDLNDGFNLRLYDKGSKADVFYPGYAQNKTVSGFFGTTENIPTGSFLLKEPFIITGPGVLGWEIVNRSSTALRIQVLIDCAVPINAKSIHNLVVSKG